MKTCTSEEFLERWQRGLPLLGDGHAIPASPEAGRRTFNIETIRTGQGVPVARQLVRWVDAMRGGQLLALVFEWGIWDSSENEHLFYAWWEWKHDFTLLEDRPGHIFLSHERLDCESLVFMALCYGWGVCVGSSNAGHAAYVNHDGQVTLVAMEQSSLDLFKPPL